MHASLWVTTLIKDGLLFVYSVYPYKTELHSCIFNAIMAAIECMSLKVIVTKLGCNLPCRMHQQHKMILVRYRFWV